MLAPISPNEWDRAKAAHLLNRTGFGGPPEQIDALAAGGMAAAFHQLVEGPATLVPAVAPAWAQPRDLVALRESVQAALANIPPGDEAARQKARQEVMKTQRRAQVEDIVDLGAWWLERMHAATDPLEEKLTLFWHGHFATSAQKVHDAYLMWRQNQTFREHARGNFGVLVKAMSRDPAMIDWLDLQQSRAQHPNENFAREVMELFTLGEGHYTEKDVTEGARAFTGYRIDPRDESFHFQFAQHDNTPKQFLGRTVLDGDQVIDTILAQPACAEFMARKLWTFFAYENPPAPLVAALAQTMRASNYEMRPVLRQMFASQEFYSPQARRTQIKSPVQWLVESTRTLAINLPPKMPLMGSLRQLGQTPFAPPSVKGWDGGKAWISTSTLLFRYNLAGALVAGNIGGPKRPGAVFRANAKMPGLPEEAPAMADAAAMTETPGEPLPLPVGPAPLNRPDFRQLAPPGLRADPPALVANLAIRLFTEPLSPKDQQPFIDYLHAAGPTVTDQHVAELLHLMMSTPHFQLC